MKEVLNRIQEVLDEQERSQAWLARKMNKSRNAISQICRNEHQPHLKDLKKIAEILGVRIAYLLVERTPPFPNEILEEK